MATYLENFCNKKKLQMKRDIMNFEGVGEQLGISILRLCYGIWVCFTNLTFTVPLNVGFTGESRMSYKLMSHLVTIQSIEMSPDLNILKYPEFLKMISMVVCLYDFLSVRLSVYRDVVQFVSQSIFSLLRYPVIKIPQQRKYGHSILEVLLWFS